MSTRYIEKIKTVKEKLNLTSKAIALATEVTPTTIGRYLSGECEMPDYWIERFCTVFHVDSAWMHKGKGELVFTEQPDAVVTGDTSGAGARMRQMRKELGLDRRSVYEVLGIKETMYSRLENGHARLTEENARKLEDAFGYGADWILYGDESRKKFPVGRKMIEWLWNNEKEREHIWYAMKNDDQT